VLVVQTQIKRFSTNTNIENPEFRDCIDFSYSTRSLSATDYLAQAAVICLHRNDVNPTLLLILVHG